MAQSPKHPSQEHHHAAALITTQQRIIIIRPNITMRAGSMKMPSTTRLRLTSIANKLTNTRPVRTLILKNRPFRKRHEPCRLRSNPGPFLRDDQIKIASMEYPFPRGTIMGKQVTGPRLSEAEHFRKCPLCGGCVDLRDRLGSTNISSRCRTPDAIGCSRALRFSDARFLAMRTFAFGVVAP